MNFQTKTAKSQKQEIRQAANFPTIRPRRLRISPQIRAMVRETNLAPNDLIYPLFVTHGRGVKTEISSMPGVYHLSPDMLADEIHSVAELGIPAVLLFGIPAEKDPIGLENFSDDGIIQQAASVNLLASVSQVRCPRT